MNELPEPPKPSAGQTLNEYVSQIYRWLIEVKEALKKASDGA